MLNHFVGQMRDVKIQQDRMRFRKNMFRIGQIMAYEISRHLEYVDKLVETPLGTTTCRYAPGRIVIGTILRAGLPFHNGFLDFFEEADNAFIGAMRRHHRDGSFEIGADYLTAPDLTGATLILCDPMLATGASAVKALELLRQNGTPRSIHFATIIASTYGIEYLRREYPDVRIWTAAVDEELTAKSYIVPGLGDAGDLAFGPKGQD